MRISVIGLPGSGKSTLARAISEKLVVPHIHIDRFWFEAGGRANSASTPNLEFVRAQVKEKVIAATAESSWVSDGFYSRIQPQIAERADSIIFLDTPLFRRILNHTLRILHRNERHVEVSLWDDVKFFSEIIRRTFVIAPKINHLVAQYKDKVIILKSRKEIQRYLWNLK